MDKNSSIVKVDHRDYRRIAQENWGLTDSQMAGMHVHHRIPRSVGGTNDASNLFVCSPSFHYYAWHGESGQLSMILTATENGRLGGLKHTKEHLSRAGKLGAKNQPKEARRKRGKKLGSMQGPKNVESGFIYTISTPEGCKEGGKKTGGYAWWTNGKEETRSPHRPGPDWLKGRKKRKLG